MEPGSLEREGGAVAGSQLLPEPEELGFVRGHSREGL